MSTYKELLAQRELLEKQIAEAKAAECASIISDIKSKMQMYGITLADLGFSNYRLNKLGKTQALKSQRSVPAKYKDPVTGYTWSGRGKPPHWIVGKNRDHFLIQS